SRVRDQAFSWRIPLAAALLLLLAGLTWTHSASFADSETLYRNTAADNPDSWLAHNNLGMILAAKPNRLQEAISEFREAVRIEPDYRESKVNLGGVLAQSGDPQQVAAAVVEYKTAIRLKPNNPEAYNNLGNALSRLRDQWPEAISSYETALKLKPDLAE